MRKRYLKIQNGKVVVTRTRLPSLSLFRHLSGYIRKHVYIPVTVHVLKPKNNSRK